MTPNHGKHPERRGELEPAVFLSGLILGLICGLNALVGPPLLLADGPEPHDGAGPVDSPTQWADSVPFGEPTASEGLTAPSIHQRELLHWRLREEAGWQPWRDRQDLPVAPLERPKQAPEREVHGYHPYWMGSAYTGYQWDLLSTVAFFSLELDGTGNITNDHGWPWTGLVSAAHAANVRVIITATLYSASAITTLLVSPAHRANAIGNLLAAANDGGADGVSIDFEGVPGSQKQNLVSFLGELQAGLQAELTCPYLSIATPAVDWNNAFDYDALAASCDHLMIMGYDYHWAGSATTGPVAPLTGWSTFNVGWTIANYLYWGAPPAKMLLGVPYYGYCWPATSAHPGASTIGGASALSYAQAWPEAEYHGRLWDVESQTPWYRHYAAGWYQTWFDDAESLGLKYDLVAASDLGGIGIWALGYDGSRQELWDALDAAFGSLAVGIDPGTEPGDTSRPAGPAAPPEESLCLSRAWPNPFNPQVRFELLLNKPTWIRVNAYDLRGRLVDRIVEQGFREGEHVLSWAPQGLPAGVYLLRAASSETSHVLRVLLAK
jgi:spore germination protein YaaH